MSINGKKLSLPVLYPTLLLLWTKNIYYTPLQSEIWSVVARNIFSTWIVFYRMNVYSYFLNWLCFLIYIFVLVKFACRITYTTTYPYRVVMDDLLTVNSEESYHRLFSKFKVHFLYEFSFIFGNRLLLKIKIHSSSHAVQLKIKFVFKIKNLMSVLNMFRQFSFIFILECEIKNEV